MSTVPETIPTPAEDAAPEAPEGAPAPLPEDLLNILGAIPGVSPDGNPPGYIGTLEQAEVQALASLRQTSQNLLMEIGQLEVRKVQMVSSLNTIDKRAQGLMAAASERFGLDPEAKHQWSVMPDGKVCLVDGPPGG